MGEGCSGNPFSLSGGSVISYGEEEKQKEKEMGSPPRFCIENGSLELNFSTFLNRLLHHWVPWAFFLSAGVLWGLPNLPFYQEGLPYLYDLGGSALVAYYLSLGCLSFSVAVGTFFLFSRKGNFGSIRLKRLTLSFGGLAVVWITLYLWLMNQSAL